jgi:hypothetical protein
MAGFDSVLRVFNESLTTDAKQPKANVHIKMQKQLQRMKLSFTTPCRFQPAHGE